MTKKPKAGPELPPGKACFPQPFVIVQAPLVIEPELDPKTRKTRAVPIDELHRRNNKHNLRSMQVRTMAGMTKDAFKKKHGYKKTLAKIRELVGEADAEDVGPEAIKKSCDLVDDEINKGRGNQFFVADWPPRKLGKKRPRQK